MSSNIDNQGFRRYREVVIIYEKEGLKDSLREFYYELDREFDTTPFLRDRLLEVIQRHELEQVELGIRPRPIKSTTERRDEE